MIEKSEFCYIDTHGDGHACAFEFVPHQRKPKNIYVVFDGERIAYRGDRANWVAKPGYTVVDEDDTTIAIYFHGQRFH
jgi:hypothetical protein